MTEEQGASENELLLALCRGDQEDDLINLLEEGKCNVNYTDGAGNSGAHYAAKTGSIGCLEALVNEDDINLDIQNRLEGETPLHLAVKYAEEDPEMAEAIVELLLAGGADPSIENRNKLTPIMLVNPKFQNIKDKLNQSAAGYEIDDSDLVDEADFADDGECSGSGSEDED